MLSRAAQLFSPELANTSNLKLHVVGAVYGAKLAWSLAHDGQEPPAEVVRSPTTRPPMDSLFDRASNVPTCSNLCAWVASNAVCDPRVTSRGGPLPWYFRCLP